MSRDLYEALVVGLCVCAWHLSDSAGDGAMAIAVVVAVAAAFAWERRRIAK